MKRLTDSSASPYISNHQDEDVEEEKTSRLGQLQRRLVPEQAMTSEELKVLVENDQLGKLMEELMADMECERELLQREEKNVKKKNVMFDSGGKGPGEKEQMDDAGASKISEATANEDVKTENLKAEESEASFDKETMRQAEEPSEKDVCTKNE